MFSHRSFGPLPATSTMPGIDADGEYAAGRTTVPCRETFPLGLCSTQWYVSWPVACGMNARHDVRRATPVRHIHKRHPCISASLGRCTSKYGTCQHHARGGNKQQRLHGDSLTGLRRGMRSPANCKIYQDRTARNGELLGLLATSIITVHHHSAPSYATPHA